jgi:medium-chain acyl-[acyl-carrier-protein] hydrolase
MGSAAGQFAPRAREDRSGQYVRPIPLPEASIRLFAFPYAGGSAVAYHSWAGLLGSKIELISIQYPGRGRLMGKAPYRNMSNLVDEVLGTVTDFAEKPFWFFGHSMGATVAFELARRLRALKLPLPRGLVVSARSGPTFDTGQRQAAHTYSDPDFLVHLQRYGGMRPEILCSPDMLRFLMPLIRADLEALETWAYVPQTPLDLPIIALGGEADHSVSPASLKAWGELTTARFDCRLLPGGHFYLQEQAPEVISILRRTLLSI